ncbi:hypothetical protein MBM_06743 [Drepanopeziza brunnea f. sp. 'multigermtubi' MB_m1]|uniref:Deacetylase sirtuin-type domain-containing protein n=2 Tax=Drepanopeziza brunnea f. sp. 'multigermtubi' TaxID=698441 RepID=K1WRE5_MARBU|nr:uncharacterized protein MBM_06743 [Drepanopeziza brunnea f. sp. 'multigermtubi' MB_m1]EKD14982.1 hypothetical protein MBM_06743 [Drepanopeziza brunnea f. sp. 'multigermtubi' MB_m1]
MLFPSPQNEKKKTVVLAGAGLSTAAGIPDSRTPGAGLYVSLLSSPSAPGSELPFPEAQFELSFFRMNPHRSTRVRERCFPISLIRGPGPGKPRIALLAMLWREGFLGNGALQYVDGLEAQAGILERMFVQAHGGFDQPALCELPV